METPRSTRRQILAAGAALTGAAAGLSGGGAAAEGPPAAAGDGAADLLDAGLARVQDSYPSADVHRSNHSPMVIEALSVLGRADAIGAWLDAHHSGGRPDPGPGERLDPARWRELLGLPERFSDWRALFLRELAADGWRAVLRRWAPRLAPGLAGAATHGLIRTAHGARALAARDREVRRRELATGLAYWAATYEELPWDGSLAPEASAAAALARVETRQPALAPPRGNIVAGLRALRDTPSFLPVAGLVDPSDPERLLREMAPLFARVYLRHPARRIAFTHSITAPSALRLVAPYLDEETAVRAARFAWQAAAGLYAVYGDPRAPAPPERPLEPREGLAESAARNGGAHAIKLVEACLREDAVAHDPVLLQAAQDAALALDG